MSNHRPQDSWGSWNSTNVHEEEVFELDETGNLQDPAIKKSAVKYKDGSSIDWLQEEALERERDHAKKSQRSIRALLSIWADSARVWLVVVATGIGIGVAGAWLDVLVKWCVQTFVLHLMDLIYCYRLGDLREGRCQAGFFHNQVRVLCLGLVLSLNRS